MVNLSDPGSRHQTDRYGFVGQYSGMLCWDERGEIYEGDAVFRVWDVESF